MIGLPRQWEIAKVSTVGMSFLADAGPLSLASSGVESVPESNQGSPLAETTPEADRQPRIWTPPEAEFSDIADLTSNNENMGSDGNGTFTALS